MTSVPIQQAEFLALVKNELAESDIQTINNWLVRGDGVAIYENQDLGHPDVGAKQFVSFGSPAAQLEVDQPPERLPDIGNKINWRYWLIGTYKGEPIQSAEGLE